MKHPDAQYRCLSCEHEWAEKMPRPTFVSEWDGLLRKQTQGCPKCGHEYFKWVNYLLC